MSEATRPRRIAALAALATTLALPVGARAQAPRHPLDPLDPADIEVAVAAVRQDKRFADTVRFVSISPNEPSKEVVRNWHPGDASAREAFLILLDGATGRGYEAVVDLTAGAVRRYDALPE